MRMLNMKTLNIAVIGAGRIGKVHAENIVRHLPNARVAAVCDVRAEAARELAERLGIPEHVADPAALLARADIDAVVIGSSTDTHADLIRAAARAGKHVFCEKPVDFSLEKIGDVIRTVEQAGVRFMVGFNRRFDPNFSKLREAIAAGRVGELYTLHITSRDPSPPPATYVRSSGGIFMDMAIHDFDMARFLAGSEVREVYARGAVRVDPAIGAAGDFDTAMITLTFEDGTIGSITNCRKTAYGYDQRVEAFGSDGMISVENQTPDTLRWLDAGGYRATVPLHFFMERYTQSYIHEMQAFIASVLEGKAPPVGGLDGLQAARIAVAADRSARENRPVPLAEVGPA
jgi:myo-inositol 2-dehydrogenase/D-chiro-inositol 1-dehydrogenase